MKEENIKQTTLAAAYGIMYYTYMTKDRQTLLHVAEAHWHALILMISL